jgi:hypothetical protein
MKLERPEETFNPGAPRLAVARSSVAVRRHIWGGINLKGASPEEGRWSRQFFSTSVPCCS